MSPSSSFHEAGNYSLVGALFGCGVPIAIAQGRGSPQLARALERAEQLAALAIIGLAISVCACGGANPTAPVVPAPAGDLKSSLSTSFDALTIPASAACSISISQHGQVVLERGRGQVAPGLPASGDSLYRIASLTKPIIASGILVSEQAGRLLRSDKVNRLPAYPEAFPPPLVRIRRGSTGPAPSRRPPPISIASIRRS